MLRSRIERVQSPDGQSSDAGGSVDGEDSTVDGGMETELVVGVAVVGSVVDIGVAVLVDGFADSDWETAAGPQAVATNAKPMITMKLCRIADLSFATTSVRAASHVTATAE